MGTTNADFYHVGIVVEDFDGTCERMGKTIGLTWSPLIETTLTVWTRAGNVTADFKAVYSVQGPVHYEIVAPVPGTVCMPTPNKPLHHFGYWTDDIVADSARLTAEGNPMVMGILHEGKPVGMCYHEMPGGMFVELVDRNSMGDWGAFLRGEFKFVSRY